MRNVSPNRINVSIGKRGELLPNQDFRIFPIRMVRKWAFSLILGWKPCFCLDFSSPNMQFFPTRRNICDFLVHKGCCFYQVRNFKRLASIQKHAFCPTKETPESCRNSKRCILSNSWNTSLLQQLQTMCFVQLRKHQPLAAIENHAFLYTAFHTKPMHRFWLPELV